jgi:type IX secretion system PorP/SprF family membrane protein
MKKLVLTTVCCLFSFLIWAQDPKFSQYFAAPLILNPANTGFFDGEYRAAINMRQQWGNLGDPYNTYSVSGDIKLVKDENFTNSFFSIGLSGLFEESFNKALKSQYISASFSYYQYLDVQHRFKFGLAPQLSFNSKFLDYSRLTFASQYDGSGGFNNSMPNYLDLDNNKTSYFDVSIGANFSATFDYSSFVLGYSLYHLNRPVESLLNSGGNIVPFRHTVNFSGYFDINNNVDLNITAINSIQQKNNDTMIGGVIGFRSSPEAKIKLNAGLWYRFNESSIYPYVGATMGNVSAGINYTVYSDKITNITPRTYELSIIYRHNNFKGFKVPCPKF